jgi:hypothetical protein
VNSFAPASIDPTLFFAQERHLWNLLLLLQVWKEFEIRHGNEDTMREMLRIKRSVQATYNTQINMMSAQMLAEATNAEPPTPVVDSMKLLDTEAAQAPPSVNHLKFA